MVNQFLKLALRDTNTQRSQVGRIVFFTKAYLHVWSMFTHFYLEGLRLSTDIDKVCDSFVKICLDGDSYKLYILDRFAKVCFSKNVIIIYLDIYDLSVDKELWLTTVGRRGKRSEIVQHPLCKGGNILSVMSGFMKRKHLTAS